ncbi:MAG: hypothetical protein MJA32_04055 [Proteobacteria bacterium]|nr:hypothetical protein [Pseudomonadota bacterium]
MNERFDDTPERLGGRLATEIAPGRDLWPGIEEAITQPRRSRRTPMLLQAAAVVLLIGASSAVTYVAVKGDKAPAVSVAPELVFEQAAFGGNYRLGPGFRDARNSLRAGLHAELDRLSPDVRKDVQANIEVIHTAIVEINAALEEDPDNVLLQQKLLRAYREELNLLRHVGSVTRRVTARNDI